MLKLRYRGIEINGFCKNEEKNIARMVICKECADKYRGEFEINTSELKFETGAGCGIARCKNEDWDTNEVETAWIELNIDGIKFTKE